AGDPVVSVPRLLHPTRTIRRWNRLPRYVDRRVLRRPDGSQIVRDSANGVVELRPLLCEVGNLSLERRLVRARQASQNPAYRLLHLSAALEIIFQNGDTQRLERVHDLVAEHLERLCRVARNQYALPMRHEVPDQVRDRVALPSARRALY